MKKIILPGVIYFLSLFPAFAGLFYPMLPVDDPAPHTFVFFINGDSDHFVDNTTNAESGTYRHRRVDSFEERRIEEYAQECRDCNVIILHDQRGTKKWYMTARPWAVWLRVYHRGERILSRYAKEINSADPQNIAQLLNFSQTYFPAKSFHFIYRGHAFFPSYLPGENNGMIVPFDYSHKNSPFSVEIFAQGIQMAKLRQPLTSITLASCSMSYLEVATALAPYADNLIASQLDVLEVLQAGYDYAFLKDIRDNDSPEKLTRSIAESLLQRFEEADLSDAMFEYPISLIKLSGIASLNAELNNLIKELPQYKMEDYPDLMASKMLSARYVESLRAKGKDETEIAKFAQLIKITSPTPNQLDLKVFLQFLIQQDLPEEIKARAKKIINNLQIQVQLFRPSPLSQKGGLSFMWGAKI